MCLEESRHLGDEELRNRAPSGLRILTIRRFGRDICVIQRQRLDVRGLWCWLVSLDIVGFFVGVSRISCLGVRNPLRSLRGGIRHRMQEISIQE